MGAIPTASTINTLEVNMLEAFANWVSKFIKVKPQPGYLGRDMARKCAYDGGEIGSTDVNRKE